MNNENNNIQNEVPTNVNTVPSVEPQVQTMETPATANEPVVAPVTTTPVDNVTPQYSTPTINTENERVIRVETEVAKEEENKDYNAIEEQLGSSEKTDSTISQPQVATVAVNEVNNEVAKDNILSSITLDEDDNKQSGNAESVTFDYNAIYGNKEDVVEETTKETEETKEVFSAKELNIQDRANRTRADIAPEFNMNALEGIESETKSQDNVLSEKQQDRADTRRKIMFIGGIVLILIIDAINKPYMG